MRKLFLLTGLIIFSITAATAQSDYKTGVGLRLNYGYGLSIKHNMSERKAIEGIVYTRWRGINITGLYEIHAPAFQTAGWRWYYGVGGHVGVWGNGGQYGNPWFDNNDSHAIVGADGILGLEYTFREIPLNLSVDWKPAINVIGYQGLWLDDIALTARFAIK
ncbi:hypothetical protein [Emticicia sp. 21SJ11W-3]|uniref:hypothetical protein n=2 Tax=Leadbetterellaceae TaxID=3141702 RepID=UPI0020A009C4|nr:hypothetical protein [Emticicia sp. 21SJ11W-3]UTA69623.1 hypothetical protein MB380_07385 [Emticicia sp. 21SJ11W-3]